MTTEPVYEYEPNALSGEWWRLDKTTWLSWSGRRRLNGREYHGPLLPLGGNAPVKRQARVCPCYVCQQTNPWMVDAIEYREQRDHYKARAEKLLAALEVIRARTQGDWDHPALVAFGPMGVLTEDIMRILNGAIGAGR